MAVEPDLLPRAMSLAVHELRTPVTVVSGYIRMLLREQAGPLTDKQRKMLEEADKSCGRIGAVVEELSELGKIEGNRIEWSQQEVDVGALVVELASGMQEGTDRDITLEVRGIDRPLVVAGDRSRLSAALKALMHATVREHWEPGAVIAQCSTCDGRDVKYVVVAMGDESLLPALIRNGNGDSLAFDEWRGGTGMSLPVARRVIERHGGAVWSAATTSEIAALDRERVGGDKQQVLSDEDRREFTRKRGVSALRLPLRT
jgi:signal transduction histidine kinase